MSTTTVPLVPPPNNASVQPPSPPSDPACQLDIAKAEGYLDRLLRFKKVNPNSTTIDADIDAAEAYKSALITSNSGFSYTIASGDKTRAEMLRFRNKLDRWTNEMNDIDEAVKHPPYQLPDDLGIWQESQD